MRFALIITVIALIGTLIGVIGFDYSYQYNQERDLESLIVSCMEKYGHYSDKLVSCLNYTPNTKIKQEISTTFGMQVP